MTSRVIHCVRVVLHRSNRRRFRNVIVFFTLCVVFIALRSFLYLHKSDMHRKALRNNSMEVRRDFDRIRTVDTQYFQMQISISDLFRMLKLHPILLDPDSLKMLRYGHNISGRHFGILADQAKKIQEIADKRGEIKIQRVQGPLPPSITPNTARSRDRCIFVTYRDIVVTLIYVFVGQHFVYIPSCGENPGHLFASAVLGDTPLVFDKFDIESINVGGLSVFIPDDISAYIRQFPSAHHHECRHDLARNLTNMTEIPERADRTMKSMLYLKRKLESLGKAPMLFYGSLLGWYRQCGVIFNDSDSDFAIYRRHLDGALHQALMDDTGIDGITFNLPSQGLQYQLAVVGTIVDLFIMYDTGRGDRVYVGEWAPPRDFLKLYYPRSEVCSAILYGHRFNIPCRIESVLEAEYGDQWQTPTTDWVWFTSPHNIQNLGPWPRSVLWPLPYRNLSDTAEYIDVL